MSYAIPTEVIRKNARVPENWLEESAQGLEESANDDTVGEELESTEESPRQYAEHLTGLFENRPTGHPFLPVKEAGWHRGAIIMLATGRNCTEVAHMFDKSAAAVSLLQRAPWAQRRIAELMADPAQDVLDAFRSELRTSLDVIVSIRDDEKAPSSVRLTASNSIIDRVLGKAMTKVEVSGPKSETDPVKEAQRLREEIARGTEKL